MGHILGPADAPIPIATLVTSRPDVDVAKDIKAEFLAKAEEICALIDKAHGLGFEISFSIGPRWDGKRVINQLTVAKHF